MANNKKSKVNHPEYYGGKDNIYEAINVIEAWGLDFVEGNILKYLFRYKNKNGIEDLKKCKWYFDYLIKRIENGNKRNRWAKSRAWKKNTRVR